MRKVTRDIVKAFINGKAKSSGTTITDGQAIYLHGHKIACREDDGWPGLASSSVTINGPILSASFLT